MGKERKTNEMIDEIKETKLMPDSEMVPAMYCINGKATCKAIDTKQICQCFLCPLWDEYDLLHSKPMRYYCRDGAAK
jgi:hypothetical protein